MSRTSEVLKNRNKVEKARKARRKSEITSLRTRSAFKARLHADLKHIDVILEDEDIEAVVITVPDKSLALFNTALYSEDLVGYDVEQSSDNPNKFYIRRKYIVF